MNYLNIPVGEDGIPKTTANMKAKFIGEFSFPRTMIDEHGNDFGYHISVPWITCKEIFKEMVVFAAKENESVHAQDGESRCVHCGAGDDNHHSYSCPTGLHPDRRR